ncbi:MAG: type II secretion system protein GspK, partial [Gammaproteobacteria bacterium]|nr:type II secretion system protein GspK [Gammaproteobacteria bacterium]
FKDQPEMKNIKDAITDQNEKTRFEEDLKGLDVQSSYFLVDASATVGRSRIRLNSIIYRRTSGEMLTISRAQGTNGI